LAPQVGPEAQLQKEGYGPRSAHHEKVVLVALKMMQPQPQGSLDAVPLSRASRRATEEQSQGEHVQRARPIQKNGATAAQQKLAGDICEAQASSVFEDD